MVSGEKNDQVAGHFRTLNTNNLKLPDNDIS
ncbi:hypothetical protein SPSYN_00608 [Sporotomaculum syntrophicum]|uniref:Uncharacterized protein n=1 Tax=Sporotomaculum syntrophicum TaxID=182264 RepID=A0A9D2WRR0_9FIRM|nr:hypothetical protein SPSYN_00608 [Sporotomaculum syntrophicum]